ncbi:MAG TPA: hypothetical protein VKV29_09525 [Chthonomonas sp.]|uniref:hypothetical protein n=1 Tax=Chthonomonas sp. TaxID=2282153 RepID=UPI002B4B1289|nr:hypothetical protein [Chthonomonas sp.]HLH80506.1 hypothetical protein [Chthonomonas sp.]
MKNFFFVLVFLDDINLILGWKQSIGPDRLAPPHIAPIHPLPPIPDTKEHPYHPTQVSPYKNYFSTRNAYYPGFVLGYAEPLRDYMPRSLYPACFLLERGCLAQAAPLFKRAIAADPQNPALYLAYLQAAPSEWSSLLPKYENDAAQYPSAVNEFKLGVLLLFIHHNWEVASYGGPEAAAYRAAARRHLSKAFIMAGPAYEKPLDCLIATYCMQMEVQFDLGGLEDPNGKAAPYGKNLEMLLHRALGDKLFAYYLLAKKNKFYASPPSLARLDDAHLKLAYEAVYHLSAVNSIGWNPKLKMSPAFSFYSGWHDQIKQTLEARSSH